MPDFRLPFLDRVEHLGHGVDLVVVLSVWELAAFFDKCVPPGCCTGQPNLTTLEKRREPRHPLSFRPCGIIASHFTDPARSELLAQGDASCRTR